MTDLVRDLDLVCERVTFLFRDLDLRGLCMALLAAGLLSISLKPFVYL